MKESKPKLNFFDRFMLPLIIIFIVGGVLGLIRVGVFDHIH